MKKFAVLMCFLFAVCFANAQPSLNRSHAELNIGAGRRAYINSKNAMLRGMLSANYNYKINNVFYLRSGLDLNYYEHAFNGDYSGPGYILTATSQENYSVGLFLGGEVVMNRIIFQGGMSRYIYYKPLPQYNLKYYSRIGFKYLISPHVNVGFFLKAHNNEADYLDFGIGYKF
jgi:hypothetical protein